jgi:hypothetical protein
MLYRIYKIENNIDRRVYIGSTTQLLYLRWNDHKKRWRKKDTTQYASSVLFDEFGYENCNIKLLEEVYCDDYNILFIEREYIDAYGDNCVNKIAPVRTKEERAKYHREWSKSHYTYIGTTQSIRAKYRVCCLSCKKELSLGCLPRHIKTVHN